MKPVDQIDFREETGDCLRACIASILEFSIEEMPNFWEATQDARDFWKMVELWLTEHKGFKLIAIEVKADHEYFLHGLLCIALGKSQRAKDHAVVWRDGIIHDPHPTRMGIVGKPEYYALFIPADPLRGAGPSQGLVASRKLLRGSLGKLLRGSQGKLHCPYCSCYRRSRFARLFRPVHAVRSRFQIQLRKNLQNPKNINPYHICNAKGLPLKKSILRFSNVYPQNSKRRKAQKTKLHGKSEPQ